MNVIVIEDWSIGSPNSDPYTAPEMLRLCLSGRVFNHPRFFDGHRITTSAIVGKNTDGHIVTASGNVYCLGNPSKDYEAAYPGARDRFLSSVKETSDAACD